MGYREIEHLSDRAIVVTAPSLAGLFADAAAGMYAVMDVLTGSETASRDLEIKGFDWETLLVGFLSECLNIAELDRLAVQSMEISFEPERCRARLQLARITSMHENIKAVTYSQMKIVQKDGNFETIIVFDL